MASPYFEAETLSKLERIAAALEKVAAIQPLAESESVKDLPPWHDAEPTPAPEVKPVQEVKSEPEQVVTRDEIRQRVVKLSAAGKKAQVREIVLKYADSVTNLPEDKLPEIMKALEALGA